jgi:hypothetical protein
MWADGLERVAADDQRIDRGDEGLIAVLFPAAGRQPIEAAVGTGDEAVEAGGDEDGCLHFGTVFHS